MIATTTLFYRATVCFHCGRELNRGVRPARHGVCPPCTPFTIQYERSIREHNAALDSQDTTPIGACVDSGRLTPNQAASTRALRSGKTTTEVL